MSQLVDVPVAGAVIRLDGIHPIIPPAVMGALFHALFLRRYEVEQFMYTLLAAIMATVSAVFAGYIFQGWSVFAASIETLGLAASFHAGMFASMLIYRAFLHPLNQFPGPFGAKLSRFWSAAAAAKNIQYYKEVDKMCEQYGDFVRTGPRELCITRSSALPLIYGPKTECRKSTWYAQVNVDYRKTSIHMTRDHDAHRLRRRAWDQGFSIKALNTYVPRVLSKVDQFLDQLSSSKNPINASAWNMYLTFDVMGEVGFSKDFGNVTKGVEHAAIKAIHDHMEVLGVMSHLPWLLNIIPRIPGASAGYAPFFGWCANEVKAKQETHDVEEYPQDLVSWLIRAFVTKAPSAPPSDVALHDDSRVIIIAGSDTTATTLTWIMYYLCKNPRVLAKLQEKVDAVMPRGSEWSYEKVREVTYIDDVIHEALRLKPALLTGGYRQTPPQGLQVDEVFIPGNTNVFMPARRIQTDPRYWKEAESFIPERWGERREEMGTDQAPYLPFSGGPYSCPGKNLAMLTMRTTVSRLAQNFSVAFAAGETGDEFERGAKDTFTTTLGPCMVEVSERQ